MMKEKDRKKEDEPLFDETEEESQELMDFTEDDYAFLEELREMEKDFN